MTTPKITNPKLIGPHPSEVEKALAKLKAEMESPAFAQALLADPEEKS